MTTVYLAGPIHHASDGGHGWRDYVTSTCDDFEWINPLDKYDGHANDVRIGDGPEATISVADLVESDKRLIDRSDALLVGWRRVPSVGTPMEIGYAFERGLPVVVWLEPEGSTEPLSTRALSPWLEYHASCIDLALGPCLAFLEGVDSAE